MRLQNSTIDFLARHGKEPKITNSRLQQVLNATTLKPNHQTVPAIQPKQPSEDLKATKEVVKTAISLVISENTPQKLPKIQWNDVGKALYSGRTTTSKQDNGQRLGWTRLPRLRGANTMSGSGRSSGKSKSGGASLSKAVSKWLLAERRLTVSVAFPKIVDEQKREKHLQLEQVERERFHQLINNLPRIEAKLSDHKQIDAFWEFFADLNEGEVSKGDTLPEDNLERFLRFCKLHASFEKQRQVFFSMCARQMVKERQLVLLRQERDAYEEKAEFVDKLLNTGKLGGGMPTEQRDAKQCFESLVDTFAENSFKLCSLKSRLEFWETADQLEANRKPPQEEATHKLGLLNWQLQHQRKLVASLEVEITQFFK